MGNFLHRNLKNGDQYNSLFPSTTCERVALGKGDTDYSIDKMVEWILKTQNHTTKVAKTLSKSSLQYTCEAIHKFLFDHFQYKADDDDQLLRSPACAWQQRYDGIDCKSYSIIASSILLNLKLSHYIRKVGYTTPDEFTHVYVIVPFNQKTNDLNDGYFMIDGTIDTMQEPYYLVSKDEFMPLKHYGLKRPNQLASVNIQSLKKLNITSVVSFFQNISCWGGSAYGGEELNVNIQQTTNVYNEIVADINTAIQNNDTNALSLAVNDFIGITTRLIQGATLAKGERSWNACSSGNFTAFINFVTYFKTNIYPTLIQFLDQYYTKTPNGNTVVSSYALNWEGWVFSQPENYAASYNENVPLYTFTRKNYITQINAFEFVAPIVTGIETKQTYSTQSALALMQTVIHTVAPSNTVGNTGNNQGLPNDSNTNYPNDGINNGSNSTQTAGFSKIVGVGILLVGLMVAFNSTPAKPISRTSKKVAA